MTLTLIQISKEGGVQQTKVCILFNFLFCISVQLSSVLALTFDFEKAAIPLSHSHRLDDIFLNDILALPIPLNSIMPFTIVKHV